MQLRELPIPDPLGPGELLVRVTCCTVCGSDLHTHTGRRPGPSPCVLGHEMVGFVEALGDDPPEDLRGRTIQRDDRVVWSVAVACHQCRNCRRGFPQKCQSLRKYGHHRIEPEWQLNGGLAEYCHLVCGTSIVVIDRQLADEVVCPASCATATVASAIRAAGRISGARVLVLGAGMLGLTASAMSRSMGAQSVSVCDINEDRLQLAKRFGSDTTMRFEQLEGQFDIVFEMSGTRRASQAAIGAADVGGSIVLVGAVLPTDSISVDPEQVVRRLLSIHGVHNYAPQDLLTAIDFLSADGNHYPLAELVSQSYSLSSVNEALENAASDRPIRIAIRP